MAIDEKRVLEQSEGQAAAPPSYPMFQVAPMEQGILIVISYSPLHSEQIILPAEHADLVAVAWLGRRSPALLEQAREAQAAFVQEEMHKNAQRQLAQPLPLHDGARRKH